MHPIYPNIAMRHENIQVERTRRDNIKTSQLRMIARSSISNSNSVAAHTRFTQTAENREFQFTNPSFPKPAQPVYSDSGMRM